MKYAADFRRIAREALSGKWMIAVLVGLVAMPHLPPNKSQRTS